ncbi:hypothetical protein JTE90_007975 [Oedothorax gibbosus]|uniref:Uncharacterized protein n=1 Tax=Oedothorax gibbosus TaxID=931172 RepID=A0AAV6UPD9_9ARAC|nr:hypothetical protein JTE90_007975 [Oedothorax gibbosus]
MLPDVSELAWIEVFQQLGLDPGSFTRETLREIDKQMIRESGKATKQATKDGGKAQEHKKRLTERLSKQDKTEYGACLWPSG